MSSAGRGGGRGGGGRGRWSGRGRGRGNGKRNFAKATFRGKTDDMLTLRLPEEGGEAGQFESFMESLRTYAGRHIGDKKSGPWIDLYLDSGDSKWHPDSLFKRKPPAMPLRVNYRMQDAAGNDVLDKDKFDDAKDLWKVKDANYRLYYDSHVKNVEDNWDAARQTLFNRIVANCSEKFMKKIVVLKFYAKAASEYDANALLRECEIKAGGSSSTNFEGLTLHDTVVEYATYKQRHYQDILQYSTGFKAIVSKLNRLHDKAFVTKEFKWTLDGTAVKSKEATYVAGFFEGLNEKLYGNDKSTLRKNRQYPATLQDAIDMAYKWEEEVL